MIMWNITKYVWTHGSLFPESTFNLVYLHHFMLHVLALRMMFITRNLTKSRNCNIIILIKRPLNGSTNVCIIDAEVENSRTPKWSPELVKAA